MSDPNVESPFELSYEVSVADARAHLLSITLEVRAKSGALPSSLVVFMPVWTPGSYLVREYARHVEGMSARVGTVAKTARKVRKNAWQIETVGAPTATFTYRIYANEVTVRTNHCDVSHAYWNGAATYVVPEGAGDFVAEITPKIDASWQVAVALPKKPGWETTYVARGMDELMDSPFECGTMTPRSFEALGKTHDVCVWQNEHSGVADWDRIVADSRTIVEAEAALLAGDRRPEEALPYDRYTFLWHVSPRGRGGLEHAASASLLVSPSLFTTRGGYLDVLSLIAHEFLHLWNVKRIRPEGLWPYRYEAENYTRLLWWFEGATSYFDWRILRLSKLCSPREYAEHLAGELARLEATPGALLHALGDASFDAWIKAYRPDESSVNTTVSYYLKGECVCALLDLEIRARTAGMRGLDDVLRLLWWSYGAEKKPVPEDAMPAIFEQATGQKIGDLVREWVDTAKPLDVATTLAKVGLVHERKATRVGGGSLGVRHRSRAGKVVIDSVLRGSPAMRAGLDSGDEIVAIGGRRIEEGGIDAVVAHLVPGRETDIVFSRDGIVHTRSITLDPPTLGEGRLVLRVGATEEERALLDGWLGEGASKDLAS